MILGVVDTRTDNHIGKDEVIMLMNTAFGRQIFFSFAVIAAMAPASLPKVFASSTHSAEGKAMLPPPDIEAAVQSEYDGVIQKGTREAYERFIRRHPEHPLAEKAREALVKGNLR
ncbi:hypothetical protein [Rhizobium herbae]|uniref:Uncharacterized protein n=1 Tax=Rhizobium herbae TaxID=508661 RepID=A0ABS4EFG6_9HYPH|nr:hypothetical protein [Rhizobium herbae]MBP1856659.1 hypothetical protein [Rhizobium herbae]